MRKIIHIDMDCFYAAIECRDDPSLEGKPVGVGGDNRRGVLTTCNYEARRYGCRSAMPVFKALECCPDLILKPVRFATYRAESARIRKILATYSDRIEPLSLDEAYLDVSDSRLSAWKIAGMIRRDIFRTTRLTASAGVAPNKMLAKIASDWRKPNGQFAVLPDQVDAFMKDLSPRKIPGIGPRATELLESKGIQTCGDLQSVPLEELTAWFGPARAMELHQRCRGMDDRPVEQNRERRSTSVERTFPNDLSSVEHCRKVLPGLLDELEAELAKQKTKPAIEKLFVKLKFSNFQQTTRECVGSRMLVPVYLNLLEEAWTRSPHGVRLIGVGVRHRSGDAPDQMELVFGEAEAGSVRKATDVAG